MSAGAKSLTRGVYLQYTQRCTMDTVSLEGDFPSQTRVDDGNCLAHAACNDIRQRRTSITIRVRRFCPSLLGIAGVALVTAGIYHGTSATEHCGTLDAYEHNRVSEMAVRRPSGIRNSSLLCTVPSQVG